ncbi:hypothetical protein V1264_010509 [Littorina saxatilis]|uniref:Uncharacterized protein n=3 Tax=Littorina saxatilis TaxID=31220 RepID=A0AAN9APJ8_9CAEN
MAGHGVRANAVIPGGTMTDTDEEWLQLGLPDLSMQLSEVERTQPLGGSCSMQDIASVIGFLASDLANAMTGACLPVDRGALVMPSIQPQVVSEQMVEMKNMGDFNIVPTELRLQQLAELIKAGAHGPSSSSL